MGANLVGRMHAAGLEASGQLRNVTVLFAEISQRVAVVSTAAASPKVTAPGPLTLLQVVVTTPGAGSPSSVTVPSSSALSGQATA